MVTVKDRLARILKEEPYIHLQIELAEEFGVSREYIRQAVGNLHLRHLLGVRVRKILVLCPKCGKVPRYKRKPGQICRKCRLKELEKRKYTLICDWCGKEFKRKLSKVNASIKNKYKHTFCSRHCLGKWVGNTHGFAVHKKFGRLGIMKKMEIEEIKRGEVPPKTGRKDYAALLDRCAHLESDQALKIKCKSPGHVISMRTSLKRHFARLGINCDVTSRTIGEDNYVFIWKKD